MTAADLSTTAYTNFQRYLAAKKSVDDRALNHHVWMTLHNRLQEKAGDEPLRVVEIGAGIGTMVERILERDLLTKAHYTLVDAVSANIAEARRRLPAWAATAGFSVQQHGTALQLNRSGTGDRQSVDVVLEFIIADCFDFAAQPELQNTVDLLVAHALLDLFDIPRALGQLQASLKPTAFLYATINFDGNTILQPEIDRIVDDQIEAAYHATMDARIIDGLPSGDSRTGRHLFGHVRDAGLAILAAGSSDWVVFAEEQGYPADEAYFLHFIIETMRGALQQTPQLDQRHFAAWIKKRHDQIDRGELVYIAHQLDFLVQGH
ncbi:MAG: class I SAM-dependent methyltransferase [Caldilineaceae bacterium]